MAVYCKYKLILVVKICCWHKSEVETQADRDLSGVVPILGVGAGNFRIRIPILICCVADRKEYIRDNGRTTVVSSAAFISHKCAVLSSLTTDTSILTIDIHQTCTRVKNAEAEIAFFYFRNMSAYPNASIGCRARQELTTYYSQFDVEVNVYRDKFL